MARKKREEGGGNNAPWLNTFADLMNLLLCFFVLLFSMSSVDAKKFEEISISMSNSFGVFDSGGSSLEQGNLISSGMSQLNNLGEYYNSMGKASTESGIDMTVPDSTTNQNKNNKEGNTDKNKTSKDTMEGKGDAILAEAVERIEQEMQKESTRMYDKLSDLSEQYNLTDALELSMDPQFHYVMLTLKGNILFDSGSADIKKGAMPILNKISNLLSKFNGYTVEIVGHTDNIPITNTDFKDNNWLSSARALNAAEYLIDTTGLDPTYIKYSGRGEYDPIADNKTEEGRARNRRIEIRIYNEYSNSTKD